MWSAPYLRNNENLYKKQESSNENVHKTDSSSLDNNKYNKPQTDNSAGKKKWVNSYFKNKANYFQHRQSEDTNDNTELSEVPQLRTDIQARNSFLRKMQGKKKQRV